MFKDLYHLWQGYARQEIMNERIMLKFAVAFHEGLYSNQELRLF